jgi:hypothetical protein
VSGNIGVGGIAGRVEIGSTIANNAAANSNITGSGSVSRVVGWIYGSGSNITNNFANSGMTAGGSAFDPTAANYGVSKTLTELQTITPYSTPINGDGLGGLGWQFCNGTTILCDDAHPWKMPSGGTGFPILYWQP